MTALTNPPGSLRPVQFWLLAAYTALQGIELGAGLFTTLAVFPVWAGSPEGAIGWVESNPFYIEEGDFFMFASPTLMLLATLTLIFGWKSPPPVRFWLRTATILFLIVFVWSVAYFIPVQAVVKGEAGARLPVEELASVLRNFVWLNYLRQAMLVAAFGMALHAFGTAYALGGPRGSRASA